MSLDYAHIHTVLFGMFGLVKDPLEEYSMDWQKYGSYVHTSKNQLKTLALHILSYELVVIS